MEERIDKEKSKESKQVDQGLIEFISLYMDLKEIDVRTLSPVVLAFIGDSVYDLVIRTIVIEKGNAPVNHMHKQCSNFVKAPAQAKLYNKIKDDLTPDEMRIFKRGRNTKTKTQAKNVSKSSYRVATGLESLIGYLYLTNSFPRVLELIKLGLEGEI